MRITLAKATGKNFWKLISGIDSDYSDGRSLDGEFIEGGVEVDLPEGAIVVSRFAGRRSAIATIYRVDSKSEGDVYGNHVGLTQLGDGYDWDSEMLSLIDHVRSLLASSNPKQSAIDAIRQLMVDHGITLGDIAETE